MRKWLVAFAGILLTASAFAVVRRSIPAAIRNGTGGTGGGLCTGIIFNTTFTQGSDVTPYNSTPELGTFTSQADGNSGLFLVDSSTGMLKVTATDSASAFVTGSPCSSDYKVVIVAKNGSSTGFDRVGVFLRYDVTNTQGYGMWFTGSGFCTIVRDDNPSTTTTLHTGGGVPVVPANFNVYEFRIVGNTITAYFNGTVAATVTDSTYSGAGQVGVYMRNQNARIDTMQVTVNP